MYSVVCFDSPNNGYSQRVDHTAIAPSSATSFPGGIFDHGQIVTPILDYIEDFVVAFVVALDSIAPIKGRLAGVIAQRRARARSPASEQRPNRSSGSTSGRRSRAAASRAWMPRARDASSCCSTAVRTRLWYASTRSRAPTFDDALHRLWCDEPAVAPPGHQGPATERRARAPRPRCTRALLRRSAALGAYPDVAVDANTFAAELGRRLGAAAGPEQLARVRADHRHLAIACAAGDPLAVRRFEDATGSWCA